MRSKIVKFRQRTKMLSRFALSAKPMDKKGSAGTRTVCRMHLHHVRVSALTGRRTGLRGRTGAGPGVITRTSSAPVRPRTRTAPCVRNSYGGPAYGAIRVRGFRPGQAPHPYTGTGPQHLRGRAGPHPAKTRGPAGATAHENPASHAAVGSGSGVIRMHMHTSSHVPYMRHGTCACACACA